MKHFCFSHSWRWWLGKTTADSYHTEEQLILCFWHKMIKWDGVLWQSNKKNSMKYSTKINSWSSFLTQHSNAALRLCEGAAAKWVTAASTLPLGWAETGRWSRACQWPGLWSRAAVACKRFSSWRAPRWPRPANTERSVSHTGSHNPTLINGRGGRGKKGEGEKKKRGREVVEEEFYQINHQG